jgi:alpha-1,4-galacturonosyltransferase
MKATLLPPPPPPAKRRRGPRVAVLALFLCSLLVPLAFLFDRSQSGYVTTDERRRQEVVLPEFHHVEKADGDGTVNGLNQDAPKKTPKVNSGGLQKHKQTDRHTSRISTKPKVLPSPKVDPSEAVKESTQGTRVCFLAFEFVLYFATFVTRSVIKMEF